MIELVQENDLRLIKKIIEVDQHAFGEGGMNEWHLLPLIRHGRVFVIKEKDHVLGSIQYMLDWNTRNKAYIYGIAIAEESRGKGLGTRLLADSIQKLANDNIEEVELTVDPANIVAINVYHKKLGFAITEFRESEYGDNEDRLVMTLNLKQNP
ncbi:MAG: GNAT family N-acetyltransferase [Acidaminococcaceae bacterium]